MLFYPGLHQPSDARHFDRACISINRLHTRRKPLSGDIILDSGAFTELATHGAYRDAPAVYAARIRRLALVAPIEIAVAQDFMCEPFMLARSGLGVEDHQRLTIERYDALMAERLPVPIMPVLQGYHPREYRAHLAAYGARLEHGAWVGIGSVCKRNSSNPQSIFEVLDCVKQARPDLRLHGFGVKVTALGNPGIRAMLYSADSMAWSTAARKQGRNPNDWREARAFEATINGVTAQTGRWWQPALDLMAS